MEIKSIIQIFWSKFGKLEKNIGWTRTNVSSIQHDMWT